MNKCVLAFCLAVTGCSGGSAINETVVAEKLSNYKTVFVEVRTDDPENSDAVGQLKSSIVGKMAALSCFQNYITGDEPGAADLRLSAIVTGVRGVSSTGRFFFGALAGKARVHADIKLIDTKTGETVGAFSIEGKSSGGSVVAGTTPEAFEKTGEGIANYINAHK